MNFKLWNKQIRMLFLCGLLIASPLAVIIYLLITAMLGMVTKEGLNILFGFSGRLTILYIFVAGFIGTGIALILNWFGSALIYNKFWKGSYRQQINTSDVVTSFLTVDDRLILKENPSWQAGNTRIFEPKKKQTKEVLEELNKAFQIEFNKPKAGWVVRNVWDQNAKTLNTTAVSDVNGAIIGDTGSGKTTSIILPTIVYNAKTTEKPTMIINDPKGELYSKTARTLEENGYEIKVFNLFDTSKSNAWNPLTAIFDTWQKYLNPENEVDSSRKLGLVKESRAMIQAHCNLARCYRHYAIACNDCIDSLVNCHYVEANPNWFIPFVKVENETKEGTVEVYLDSTNSLKDWLNRRKRILKGETFGQIAELASTLYTTPDSRYEFFYAAAREFFEGVLQLLLAISAKNNTIVSRGNFNLKTVRLLIANKNKLFETIKKCSEGDFLNETDWKTRLSDVAITYYNDPANVENWWKTLTNALTVFDNIELENIICNNTIEVLDLVSKPTAVFLIVPDNKTAYIPLVSLFVGQIYSGLISEASNKPNLKLERKILFILDEFGVMKKIEPFTNAFAICRSRNINILICFQKESQLRENYGRNNTESILGNCQLTYFISSKDREDYEKYSKAFGMTTEIKRSFNTRDDNANESLEKRPLLSADELQQLPKPLTAILLNGNKYLHYLLPSWIAEKEYVDYYGQKVYDFSPVERRFVNNLFTHDSDCQVNLDLIFATDENQDQNSNSESGQTKPVTEVMADENSNVVQLPILNDGEDGESLKDLIKQLQQLRNSPMTPTVRRKIVELNSLIIKKQRIN